ncbi:arginine--tRNA ligase, partial [Acidobacteriota bacterium]
MYLDINRILKERVAQAASGFCELSPGDVTLEVPPKLDLGDLASPVALRIAKTQGKPPREICKILTDGLTLPAAVMSVETAGAGYLNFRFDRKEYLKSMLHEGAMAAVPGASEGKVIVEHTNINPNKAAHIGHLRNAALGDTMVKILRALAYKVEVQNYIDDTGVQVADIVVGFREIEKLSREEVSRIDGRFDHYCWDLYARVSEFYKASEDNRALRSQYLQKIEEGNNEIAAIAHDVAERIVRRHLETMERIGIRYDLLVWERHILGSRFWDYAYERLKESGAITYAETGRNEGCWVMNLGSSELFQDLEEPDKVIVRSDKTVTYVGKDIAYQLWKFGLQGRDFSYRLYHTYPDEQELWVSADHANIEQGERFGHAAKVYNVIDVRQSYLQSIVAEGLKLLGHPEEAARSVHFAYEMVAMSPRCCEEMGIHLEPDEKGKAYIEMAGRKGKGVKADDLLDAIEQRAALEIRKRHPEMKEGEVEKISRILAAGAVRYFMIKFGRSKVVVFDFQEALAFEGETGVYVQNAVVRANSIFAKLIKRENFDEGALADPTLTAGNLSRLEGELSDDQWELIYLLSRIEDVLVHCVESLDLSSLAKHAFMCAQKFNTFYHRH